MHKLRGINDFLVCVVMHLLVPLIPIGAEWYFHGHAISALSLLLALAMYCLTIGNTTRFQLAFSIYLVMGFVAAIAYGQATAADAQYHPDELIQMAWICLAFVVGSHAIERFHRHVILAERFFEFIPGHDGVPPQDRHARAKSSGAKAEK